MLGLVGECTVSTEDQCFPCVKSCNHIKTIRDEFTSTGFYGHGTVIGAMIDNYLGQQQDFLSELCTPSVNVKSLVEMTGYTHCVSNLLNEGCSDVCGETVNVYSTQECVDCQEVEQSDEFYLNVLKLYRMKKYANRNTINIIVEMFGWNVTYTPDGIFINVGEENPLGAASILPLIPAPIGIIIKITGVCP